MNRTDATVRARYDRLVADGTIARDPAQEAAAAALDRVVADLSASPEARTGQRRTGLRRSGLGRLFARRAAPAPVRGLYLHGSVGRGKTMLMDLFHAAAPVTARRRVHFAGFMADVHDRIHAVREAERLGQRPAGDPIRPVAEEIGAETRLLCLDEFAVTDIADAMILSRLFEALFATGLVLVATSNDAPEELYRNGLNRQLFLPFVDVLRGHAEVVALDGDRDYRLAMLSARPIWLTPADQDARTTMDALWRDLTRGAAGASSELRFKGRSLRVPLAAGGAARFDFSELCEAPLGSVDYLALARTFDTIFVDCIPVIPPLKRDVARRLILMVDTFYDEGVTLVASAAAAPGGLYEGPGELGIAFRRTESRLIEMQSERYLAASHGAHGSAAPGSPSRGETRLARPPQSV